MIYLNLEDYYKFIFEEIRQFAYDDKAKPNYEGETAGLDRLKGVLEFVKDRRFYPTLQSKAAYLLVTLSTGHNFGNGNKRLALFTYFYFLTRNKKTIRPRQMKTYKNWFKHYFPRYKISTNNFIRNIGWGLYNFNLCMNISTDEDPEIGHNYSFDELKDIAENFTDLFYH